MKIMEMKYLLLFTAYLIINGCASAGKALKPSSEESEASRRGCRWTYALQHNAIIPETKYAEQVMKGAEIEARSGNCSY